MRGIYFNGQHSWYTHHAVISESKKPTPEKNLTEEGVAYSNVKYDFSCLNGKQTYKDRTMQYVLFFVAENRRALLRKLDDIKKWLYAPTERIPLIDDEDEDVHYLMKCTGISEPEIAGCTCLLTVTFTGYPLKIPDRPSVIYTTSTAPYPDVDGSGSVTATDASIILQAAAAIGLDEDPGLTPAQLDLANADRDGSVTAADGSLVLLYVSQCGLGRYENSPAGWVKFMNDRIAQGEGKI